MRDLSGLGMLDAACPGQIFTSPTPDQMVAAVEAVDQGAGVILIVKNYEGDVMNFEMAAEMTEGRCATVITDDDVAVETSTYSTGRRGVAGTLIVEKIVGAAAEMGMPRAELQALGQRVNRQTRSMGVALDVMHGSGGGQAEFRTQRRGGRDGRRHPWRAGPAPRPSGVGSRDDRRNGRRRSSSISRPSAAMRRSCSSTGSARRR